jgi:hypothetical protein
VIGADISIFLFPMPAVIFRVVEENVKVRCSSQMGLYDLYLSSYS